MPVIDSTSSRSRDLVTAIGLAVGAALGMAGSFVSQASLRQVIWAIDESCLVAATVLLTLRFLRRGDDVVAAGFLVFAIGEALLLSGSAAGLAGSAPSFAGGTALWAVGLVLVSIPSVFPVWGRLGGVIAAVLFSVVALRMAWGGAFDATSKPLPFFAYPFLVLAIVGWIVALVKRE
jgi:hypothetical protein